MAYDFNTAGDQFDLIPKDTIAVVEMSIRPGDVGEDGLFTRTKNGDAEMLVCDLIVVGGKYDKWKFREWMIMSGTTDGQKDMADAWRAKLRAIIESVRNIKPTDVSEEAKKKRVAEYSFFDGVRFLAQIGIRAGKDDNHDKNVLKRVITPDDTKNWQPVQQVAKPVPASSPAEEKPNNVITRPAWAQ